MEKFIDIIDLKFNYAPNDDASNILNGINLKIKKGEFLTILGHNGSGKSTLAKHLNALLLPSFGKVFVKEIDTKNESKTYDVRSIVGLVLQNPDNQLVASIVEEDVAFGPENLGICPQKIRTLVDEALKSVDMYDYRQYATYNLSGGQKQRVAIAGVLAMQPECIILDEPTAMLDPIGRQEVISTVKKLNKENGITVVLITHYMDEAVDSDRIVVVNEGQVAKVGTPKDIFSDVKFLESCQLSIPQDIELVQKLKFNGIKLYDTALNEKECVYMIRNYLNSITKK
ncbi:MAG: energy-coupling factor transporter ATPase [Acutalibacteraceae bacterium]|jgi:energy-coupling factor transport system ATP-binding protein